MTAKTRQPVLSEESLFADVPEAEPHQTQPIDISADILTQHFKPIPEPLPEETTLRLDLDSLAAADARAALQAPPSHPTETVSETSAPAPVRFGSSPSLRPPTSELLSRDLQDMARTVIEEMSAQTPPPPKMWPVAALSGILSGVISASLIAGLFLLHDGHNGIKTQPQTQTHLPPVSADKAESSPTPTEEPKAAHAVMPTVAVQPLQPTPQPSANPRAVPRLRPSSPARPTTTAATPVETAEAPPDTLPLSTIQSVVATHRSAVDGCIQRHASEDSDEAKRITVQWNLSPEGIASGVNIQPDSLAASPIGSCLQEQILSWRFPRRAGTDPQPVELSFQLP